MKTCLWTFNTISANPSERHDRSLWDKPTTHTSTSECMHTQAKCWDLYTMNWKWIWCNISSLSLLKSHQLQFSESVNSWHKNSELYFIPIERSNSYKEFTSTPLKKSQCLETEIQGCKKYRTASTQKTPHCDLQIITSSHNMAETLMLVSVQLSTLDILRQSDNVTVYVKRLWVMNKNTLLLHLYRKRILVCPQ
jgi:hypothetical protein